MISQILFVLGAASAVIGFGFMLGLAQNISINKELAIQAAYNYDSNIKFNELIISDDKSAALAISNKGILLFKTVGSRIAVRIINKDNFINRNNLIIFSLNDIGFPNFKARFGNNDIESIIEKLNSTVMLHA